MPTRRKQATFLDADLRLYEDPTWQKCRYRQIGTPMTPLTGYMPNAICGACGQLRAITSAGNFKDHLNRRSVAGQDSWCDGRPTYQQRRDAAAQWEARRIAQGRGA